MFWEGLSEELIGKRELGLLELRDIITMCKGPQVEKSLVLSTKGNQCAWPVVNEKNWGLR